MWIWQMRKTDGGSVPRIAAKAKAYGITTVLIKAADGGDRWTQLTAGVVDELHAAGVKVCGWQYVYGHRPLAEGRVAAHVIQETGVDCFVIDAEIEYETGRHRARSAREYLRAIRARVGKDYLLGFSSFPWASLHSRLPYGVFLGPGGAQVNLPQVYWKAIDVTPTQALARTYADNRGFGRPIVPVGQTYMRPRSGQIHRFENLAHSRYDAGGVSWWDWQETHGRGWRALGATTPATAARAPARPAPAPPDPRPEQRRRSAAWFNVVRRLLLSLSLA